MDGPVAEDIFDALWDMHWIPVANSRYALKYKFDEDTYTIMITDLSCIFGESLNEQEIQKRFCDANPYAEMKSKVILKRIKECLERCVNEEDSKFVTKSDQQNLLLHLQFNVNRILFIYDVKPSLLSSDKLRSHIVIPSILTALYMEQENERLKKKIEDSERTPFSSPSKYKADPNLLNICANFNKRSQVSETDAMESFLRLQKRVKCCISESKRIVGLIGSSDSSPSSGKTSSSNSSPIKKAIKKLATQIEYDDENATDESQDSSQYDDANNLPTKRVAESMDDTVPVTQEDSQKPITKMKKKKVLKF